MTKKIVALVLVILMAISLFAACGDAPAKGMKAAMATDVGGINDQSFNESAWAGFERAEEELG